VVARVCGVAAGPGAAGGSNAPSNLVGGSFSIPAVAEDKPLVGIDRGWEYWSYRAGAPFGPRR
jgi:hypothetical protein